MSSAKKKKTQVRSLTKLVNTKLEDYFNREKREMNFDPSGQGIHRTTRRMAEFDLAYKVLEHTKLDEKSPRSKTKSKKNAKEDKGKKKATGKESGLKTKSKEKSSPVKREADNNEPECDGKGQQNDVMDEENEGITSDLDEEKHQTQNKKQNKKKSPQSLIHPSLDPDSPVLNREADRISEYATKVMDDLPVNHLCIIHRYKPSPSKPVPDTIENGRVHNLVRHVGAVLHSEKYIQFYMKEGMASSRRDAAQDKTPTSKKRRLQRRSNDEGKAAMDVIYSEWQKAVEDQEEKKYEDEVEDSSRVSEEGGITRKDGDGEDTVPQDHSEDKTCDEEDHLTEECFSQNEDVTATTNEGVQEDNGSDCEMRSHKECDTDTPGTTDDAQTKQDDSGNKLNDEQNTENTHTSLVYADDSSDEESDSSSTSGSSDTDD